MKLDHLLLFFFIGPWVIFIPPSFPPPSSPSYLAVILQHSCLMESVHFEAGRQYFHYHNLQLHKTWHAWPCMGGGEKLSVLFGGSITMLLWNSVAIIIIIYTNLSNSFFCSGNYVCLCVQCNRLPVSSPLIKSTSLETLCNDNCNTTLVQHFKMVHTYPIIFVEANITFSLLS